MISRRRVIVQAALARLQRIQTVNGFATDAGAALYIGEAPELGQDDPDAAICLLVPDDVPKQQGNKILVTLPLEIQAVAKVDQSKLWLLIDNAYVEEPWLIAEVVLEDIKRAIETQDRTVLDLERGVTRVLRREPGSTVVGMGVRYSLQYQETWGNP